MCVFMDKIFLSLLLLFFSTFIVAQSFSGTWKGKSIDTSKNKVFPYQIQLQKSGNSWTGTSSSSMPNNDASASFQLVGTWDGKELVLQEIKQTSSAPFWCLKHVRLVYNEENGRAFLKGTWEADGCSGGTVILSQPLTPSPDNQKRTTDTNNSITYQEQPITMALLGKWAGHLGQSDRDYGFYFAMDLKNSPTGLSYIVSEGNGGSAWHDLSWSFNENTEVLSFKESKVATKTAPQWKWCLKEANLQLRKEEHRYILEGSWGGYIEGFKPVGAKGKCAPGKIYLEKPIIPIAKPASSSNAFSDETSKKEKNVLTTPSSTTPQKKEGRSINLTRIIEVKSNQLKIKVWDNGSVDGDIVTIFLNEKRITHQLRVTKTKRTFPVKLSAKDNYLVLHADDLGEITPNTVAVSIDDGVKEQRLILSSNLEESGAIMVKQISR